jgi:rubrerythrin
MTAAQPGCGASEPATVPLSNPAPCRYCGDPAYAADQIRAGRPCPSCAASKTYWRSRRR